VRHSTRFLKHYLRIGRKMPPDASGPKSSLRGGIGLRPAQSLES